MFEGLGDELFEVLAMFVEESGLQVGEDALEQLTAAVRKARGFRGAWET
jgi:hypothetical protein